MKFIKLYIVVFLILAILIITGIFFIFLQKDSTSQDSTLPPALETNLTNGEVFSSSFETASEADSDISDVNVEPQEPFIPQKSLFSPPEIIKAIYLTSWSATKESFIDYLIDIVRTTEINAVVIDIKDFSGYVAYDIEVPEVEQYYAKSIRIVDIDSLIKRLHKEGIYLIARITVFQDPVLARARPDLAIHSKSKLSSSTSSVLSPSSLWLDDVGLAWIDPAAEESWNYNIAIARDALNRGFDEINFDYVRFPSDGDLKDMSFPFWDGILPKHIVIKEFFKNIRQGLPAAKISVDLFGLSTVSSNDLGVGQIIEDGFEYFDYVCPMVYPSHYADGFLGYQNPAEHPYEIIEYSMDIALRRLVLYKKSQKTNVQLRPWLQDFDLGADYDKEMVRAEIRAVYDAAGEDNFKGFMLWNSFNFYTKEALKPADLE